MWKVIGSSTLNLLRIWICSVLKPELHSLLRMAGAEITLQINAGKPEPIWLSDYVVLMVEWRITVDIARIGCFTIWLDIRTEEM